MKTDVDSLVVMGRIVAPYGIKGWVKIVPDTEVVDGLLAYPKWQLGRDQDWREIKLKSGKVQNDVLLAKLEGVNDRDAAFACKGLLVAVNRSELPVLDEQEYYWADLIGLQVSNQSGDDFGVVKQLFETGANDVMVVSGDEERLIPFTAQTVLAVDLEAQTILVDWEKDF